MGKKRKKRKSKRFGQPKQNLKRLNHIDMSKLETPEATSSSSTLDKSPIWGNINSL